VTGQVIRDGAITVELSHPDKALFGADGVTKGGLGCCRWWRSGR
jgi:hypothetical protein